MSTRAPRYVTSSQVSLAFFSAVCLLLHPGFVLKSNEGGFSNYGIHLKTAIPYSLAFGLCAYFAFRAGAALGRSSRSARVLRRLLGVYGALMVITLVSTYGYSLNTPLKDFHAAVGIATMLFEFLASVWMYSLLPGSTRRGVLLAVALLGFVLGVIDFVNLLHVLFLAQLFTGIAFGFLLVQSVSRADRPHPPVASPSVS